VTQKKKLAVQPENPEVKKKTRGTAKDLAHSRAESEAARRQYTDLYDFAPIGCFTLTRDGTILMSNLTAANLLGVAHCKLIKRRFGLFVSPKSRPAFNAFLEKVFSAGSEKVTCEVELQKGKTESFWTRIEAVKRGEMCHAIVSDVTERKRDALLQEVLYQVLRAVSIQLDVDLVAHSAVETIVRLIGYPHVCIALPDESGAYWVVRGAAGSLAAELGATHPIHRGIIGRGFKTGQAQWARDVLDDPGYLHDVSAVDAPALRSEFVAPICHGDRLLGMLNIESDRVDAFNDADVRMFKSVADVISLALENARLYAEAQREIAARVEAEKVLRESEQRFHNAFSNNPIGMALVDIHERFLQINPALCNILGYTEEQLLNTTVPAITHPDDIQVEALYKKQTESGEIQSFQFEKRYLHADGHIVWGMLSVSGVTDDAGRLLYYIGQLEDITERKQAEDALRESEEKWRSLVNASPDYIALHDREGRYLFLNHYADGFTEKDVLGSSVFQYLAPESKELFSKKMEECLRTLTTQKFEYGAMGDRGTFRTYEQYFTPIVNAKKETEILAIARDITERKQAEEMIRRSEADLKEAQRVGRLGSWDWDAATDTIAWSEEYYHIYGFDPKQSPPDYEEHLKAYTPESAARLDAAVKKSMESGIPYELDLELAHADGSRRWITARCEIKRDAKDQIVGLRGTAQDITERKQAEETLQESEEKFRTLADQSPNMIFINKKGRVVYANIKCEELTGYKREEFYSPDFDFYKLIAPESMSIVRNAFMEHQKSQDIQPYEYAILTKDGKRLQAINASKLIRYENEGAILAVVTDITARKQAEDELRCAKDALETLNIELQTALAHEQQLAYTDMLTGVNNRRHLYELAYHEFDIAVRYQKPLSAIMFDIDHFKEINDTFGHTVGDRMLQRVTEAACVELRSADVIGRYGGEEFVIILPMTNAQDALSLAERIRMGVAAIRLPTEKGDASVTLSIGIAEMIHGAQTGTAEDLIRRADKAMYAAKDAGRNRIEVGE